MTDTDASSSVDVARAAEAFRPNSRPIVLAVAANILLAATCLGVPYLRGRSMAQQTRTRFASFAACMLGGDAAKTRPGLGLPKGEEARFASLMLTAEPSWPERCRKPLSEISPPEATFLWPSVKQANADLRAVVELLDTELKDAARRRAQGPGRVPVRPLLALSKLRAALTLLARASGEDQELEREAVAFSEPPRVVQPAELPLYAAQSAALSLWASPDGLEAVALDRRGVSWMQLEGGAIDRRRLRRPGLLRALIGQREDASLVWAMRREVCAERDDRCARKATGIAPLARGEDELPKPVWLKGHAAGRMDRVMRLYPSGEIELLAVASAAGGLELRRFPPPPQVAPLASQEPLEGETKGDQAIVLSPTARTEILGAGSPLDALILGRTLPAIAFSETLEGGPRVGLQITEPVQRFEGILGLEGKGAWLKQCDDGQGSWLVHGNESGLRVGRLAPGSGEPAAATWTEGPLVALKREQVLAPENPALDSLHLHCDGERLWLLLLTEDSVLRATQCGPDGVCSPPRTVAKDVTSFDSVRGSAGFVVAVAGQAQRAYVRVLRLSETLETLGQPQVPAACWEPRGGFCGTPTLVQTKGRLLLGTREGSSLLMLESNDGGQHFKALSGLQVGTAINTDAASPMEQHKIRKGIQ